MNDLVKDNRIDEFILNLRYRKDTELVYNQYQALIPYHNLSIYLFSKYREKPEILLIAEASGYRGCRDSGIPLTSGYLLKKSRVFYNIRHQFYIEEIKNKKESTASIVYSFFNKYPETFKKTILWNIFPFHPYLKASKDSNRTPNRDERIEGSWFLLKLFELFGIKKYYPIGNIAYECLRELQDKELIPFFKFIKIRHPSYGGKKDFIKSMKSLYNLRDNAIQQKII